MAAADFGEIDLGDLSDRELLLLTASKVNQLCTHVKTQNGRLGKLEQWRSQAMGILLLAAIVLPVIVSKIVDTYFK